MNFRYQKLPITPSLPHQPLTARPYLPVYLCNGKVRIPSPYYALLDSGADHVLFPAELAIEVGIEKYNHTTQVSSTYGIAGQGIRVFYHELEIQVVGDARRFQTLVGFAEKLDIPILGRSFFRHFKKIIFEEEKENMELKI